MYFMYSQLIYISYLWVSAKKQLLSVRVRKGVSHTQSSQILMKPVLDVGQ